MTVRIDLADPAADLEPLVEALRAGRLAVLPTDTVYGIACAAHLPDACERVARAKGREGGQPTAVVCASLDTALSTVLPELHGRAAVVARRLLPGPLTLVVPNPSRRYRWLCGPTPDRIGLRVPDLEPRVAAAIDRVGAVMATSANVHGGPDPATLDAVPDELLRAVAVVVDGGPTPLRQASTVVDVTGPEPRVLREGAMAMDVVRTRLADLSGARA